MKVANILKEIDKLDLSQYPYYEAKHLIGKLGKVAVIGVNFHPGKRIIRARPNYNGEEFTNVAQLSYKPARYNTTFQRASSPNMTMFYGSVIPEISRPNELDNARVVGTFESVKLLRSTQTSGEQIITYGKWVVTKTIRLYGVVFFKNFLDRNSLARELNFAYQAFVRNYPDYQQDSLLVSTYFANCFANPLTTNDYDYLLSACFSEMTVEKGFAGVYYPSVRGEGQGFNVAIHPYFVDNFMELEAVGQCTIYKRKIDVIVDNDKSALVLKGERSFKLKDVLPRYHVGRKAILHQLYPEL